MKLSKLRAERRAARQVYPFGQRGSASELWYLHRKLSRPSEPERAPVGFRVDPDSRNASTSRPDGKETA